MDRVHQKTHMEDSMWLKSPNEPSLINIFTSFLLGGVQVLYFSRECRRRAGVGQFNIGTYLARIRESCFSISIQYPSPYFVLED